jgi:hypothetical protein
MQNKKFIFSLAGVIVAVGAFLYVMKNSGDMSSDKRNLINQDGENQTAVEKAVIATPDIVPPDAKGFIQVERLGRPAINEALVLSNDKLNAFNSIPPTFDLKTDVPAVLEVLKEASAVLDLFDTIDGKENFKNGFDSEVIAGFLPDVMRIDTEKSIPPGTAAYNGDFVLVENTQAAMLTGGRKIEDDVVDITLSYLVAGDPSGGTIKDNVSYKGEPGNTAQGHHMLFGQTAYNGSAKFPFLAKPY